MWDNPYPELKIMWHKDRKIWVDNFGRAFEKLAIDTDSLFEDQKLGHIPPRYKHDNLQEYYEDLGL